MPRHPGRSGHAWRKARALVLARDHTCHRCGQPINLTIPWPHPLSASVDHYPITLHMMKHLPMADQRRLALDPNNLRAAHFRCNSGAGNRTPPPRTQHSRAW